MSGNENEDIRETAYKILIKFMDGREKFIDNLGDTQMRDSTPPENVGLQLALNQQVVNLTGSVDDIKE